jgi:DnaJ family protein A protein 2
MSQQSYYEILGVSQKASESEIKKAYRSMSMKNHPDRNPSADAADKMREINSAYEILSDSAKRRQYDVEMSMSKMPFSMGMGGMGPMGGMPFSHMSSMDDGDISGIFQMLFGGGVPSMGGQMPEIHIFHGGMGGPMGGMGGPMGQMGGPMGGMGGMGQMGGMGGPMGQMGQMGGMRHKSPFKQAQKPSPITKQISITIEQAYHGCRMPIEIERWTMIGELKIQEEETVYITIPPGIDDNEVILIEQKGNVENEYLKGDVKINIQIENTTVFKRHGLDLIYRKAISLKESLCGFGFEIHHINGKVLNLNNTSNPTVIKPNYRKVVPGLGMNRDGTSGNLIIEFLVEFPDFLKKEQIAALSAVLE